MRIALTITELDPGGAEHCLVQLALFLQRRGHEVAVFALGKTRQESLGDSPDRHILIRQLEMARIPTHCGGATTPLALPGIVHWLRRELSEFRPDVIQSMLFHANVVTAAANKKLSALHFGGHRVREMGWMRQGLTRWAAWRMQKLICVSQSLASDCECRLRISKNQLLVIPNGISINSQLAPTECDLPPADLSILWPGKLPSELLNPEVRLLLFVGRLAEQKGVMPLLGHAEQLLLDFPDLHLVLLGDGPLRAAVQKRIADMRSGSQIHLLGWQTNVLPWMRQSELILVPSLYEGMPNVVLEAMSVARPTVCFDVEGVRELLGSDSPIQVAQPGDWSGFIQSARQFVSDRQLARQIGQKNYERALSAFQLDEQLLKYEQLYFDASVRC